MTKFSYTYIAFLTVILVSAFSCNNRKNTEQSVEDEEIRPENIVELREDQIQLAHVETGQITLRTLGGTLKTSGIVTTMPQNYATVCLPLGGYVKSTNLMEGSAVKKGQILATIENQEFIDLQKEYLEAKSRLEYMEADYKRHNNLYEQEVYSEENMQQITSEYKVLKAQVKAREEKLLLIGINPSLLKEENISSVISLISPISGYIQAVHVNLGKYVAPSDVLFEIINHDHLLLELMVFEKDADKVTEKQHVRFFINNETEQHGASVLQTGKSVGTDKTLKVYAQVTGKCKNILPGMFVNAIIETSNRPVYALPSDAIVSFDDKDYIFVFDKNKKEDGKPFTEYRMVQVQKGYTDEGFTEIIPPEGFDIQGSRVVIKGAYNLLSAKKNTGEMAC
jgi:membrane fusion protein, heavy metal efflux system